jgi:uracil-DNA glycosylase
MNWETIISNEREKLYYKKLTNFLDHQYKHKKIYPKRDNIFKAFDLCRYDDLKIVIIGQDPYHQPYQAQGLAFSTPNHIKNPPSMVNILKEVIDDIGDCSCLDGDLTPWAKQGILLINTILTVEHNTPKSHHKKGWEDFTKNIISHIDKNFNNIIFLLWGADAIKLGKNIDSKKHHILRSPHPSPLSAYRGFFGSKHFSKANNILKKNLKKEIVW